MLYTVLDMKEGFHEIELEPKSSTLTNFITPFGNENTINCLLDLV